MRLIVLLIALLAACSCAHLPRRSALEQHNATMYLRVTCGDGSTHMGTGVLVAPNQVLTANHVAGCAVIPDFPLYFTATLIEVFPIPNRAVTAVADVNIIEGDLARLKLEEPLPEYFTEVEIGPPPVVGDRLCVASAAPRYVYRCGEAQATYSGRIEFSIMTEFGNSGSAIYNDKGQLVGIVTNLIRCQHGIPCMGSGTTLVGHAYLVPES